MIQTCPISSKRIDTNMVRILAAQVALFTTLFLLTGYSIFIAMIVYDYVVRAMRQNAFSPFYFVGTQLIKSLGLKANLSDELPKRFALYLGLLSSSVILLAILLHLPLFATVVSVILIICALLEALFDFCIGCKLYYAIQLLKGFFNHAGNVK